MAYQIKANEPSVGSLVSENSPLGHFIDNCIYVLPQGDTIDAEMVQKYINNVLQHTHEFINRYECETLEYMPDFSNHSNLKDAIEKENANLLLPINTINTQNKIFLIVSSNNEDLFRNIGLMISYSEKITTDCLRVLLKQYAIEDADSFCEAIKADSWERILNKSFISRVDEFKNYKSQSITPDIDDTVTVKKKMVLYDKLELNLKKYKKTKDPQAEKELSLIIKELDTKTVLWLLSQLTSNQQENFIEKIHPIKNAKSSILKLEIKKIGTVDDIRGTDGVFRLCLNKEGQEILVHFKRRESFIIYLIYLTDKYLHESVNYINLWNYKELFLKLFKSNYDYNGTSSFEKLFKQSRNDKVYQPQLRLCYSDIRISIGNACEKLNENSSPYIIRSFSDHLTVLKSNIIIHKDILEIVKKA